MLAARCLLALCVAMLISACDPKPDGPAQPGIPPQAQATDGQAGAERRAP